MKKAYLITDCHRSEFSQILQKIDQNDLIIGIDGGANLLFQHKIKPDLIIGDLDSIGTETLEYYKNKTKIEKFPAEKNETDSELALDWCHKNSISEIILVNSLDRRFDHSLGMISLLFSGRERSQKIVIENDRQQIFLAEKETSLETRIGSVISLIPLSERVEAISTDGLEFGLKNDILYRNATRGISNISTQKKIRISFDKGDLLIILNK
ncbi:MAG: thiamine diphosphokinase [Candidatus Cloacimonetes bacterium]|nr:thiamine diphosphokinase [Candidatus Cloacimonadota bacterium]